MSALAISAFLLGGALGQFFKVLILVPAGGLAILFVLAASIYFGDALPQMALKIQVLIMSITVGYACGQTAFHVPDILQRMRKTGKHSTARPHSRPQ